MKLRPVLTNRQYRDTLKESKRMYRNLSLIGDFSTGGEARSCWRLRKLLGDQGHREEEERYYQEARIGLKALGKLSKDNMCEEDFNILLNCRLITRIFMS